MQNSQPKTLSSKRLYKILLIILKYTPVTLALLDVIYTILSYFGTVAVGLSIFGGVSFIFLLILFLLSYIFRFCYLYRIPLYYITITNLISTLKYYKIISLAALPMIKIYAIITGIVVLIYVFCIFRYGTKKCVGRIRSLYRLFSEGCDCRKY